MKLGLALGSGAARGWAHIGVIRGLVEAGYKPDLIAGCSIGAFVGAVCANNDLDKLEEWVYGLAWQDVVKLLDPSWAGGLIKGEKLITFFQRHFLDHSFADLAMPFACVATDLANGRIYLPPASIPGGHGLRSMALQAMAHRLMGHTPPASYDEFLWQRLEINYFAAACLMPQEASVAFLQEAKKEKRLAIEDFRDAFGVTHEAAALRFTNLATSQLDMTVHFLRVNGDGALLKGYENDGLPLPTDVTGSIEGQWVCKKWSARTSFEQTNRTTENYQYTDTPAGTFWCATQTGRTDAAEFSITIGVPFNQAKWFRGRETTVRASSTCPDESCCRRAPNELAERWSGHAWPSARLHAHVLSPLPSGTFPGVDDAEVYAFLEAHAGE